MLLKVLIENKGGDAGIGDNREFVSALAKPMKRRENVGRDGSLPETRSIPKRGEFALGFVVDAQAHAGAYVAENVIDVELTPPDDRPGIRQQHRMIMLAE